MSTNKINYFRDRKYKNGTYGKTRLPYMEIPDNYTIKSIITNGYDLTNGLFINKANASMLQNGFSNKQIGLILLETQYKNYLESAIVLQKAIHIDRLEQNKDNLIMSYYVIPCAYCVRHAIELFLKYTIIKTNTTTDIKKLNHTHKIIDLWNYLGPLKIYKYSELTNFITEINNIDEDGTILRYVTNKQFEKTTNTFDFNIDIMINNTKYLINIVDEFIIRNNEPIF